MYYVEIKTKNNTIKMVVESINDEEIINVLENNIILELRIEHKKEVAFVKKLKK